MPQLQVYLSKPAAAEPGEKKKRDQECEGTRMRQQQPSVRARQVYLEKPRPKEPFTGECHVCMVEYISGQQDLQNA